MSLSVTCPLLCVSKAFACVQLSRPATRKRSSTDRAVVIVDKNDVVSMYVCTYAQELHGERVHAREVTCHHQCCISICAAVTCLRPDVQCQLRSQRHEQHRKENQYFWTAPGLRAGKPAAYRLISHRAYKLQTLAAAARRLTNARLCAMRPPGKNLALPGKTLALPTR